MTFAKAIQEIESHTFAAKLGLASNFITFIRIASEQEAVKALLKLIADETKAKKLYERTINLSQRTVDQRYENPYDTALTIYLLLMNLSHPNWSQRMAEIISDVPQCWLAEKLSRHILSEKPIISGSHRIPEERDKVPSVNTNIPKEESFESILPFKHVPDRETMVCKAVFYAETLSNIWPHEALPISLPHKFRLGDITIKEAESLFYG